MNLKEYEEKLEYVTCDICGGDNCEKITFLQEKFNCNCGKVFIVRCKTCGLLYTNPRPRESYISSLYKAYYGKDDVKCDELSRIKKFLYGHLRMRKIYHWLCGNYRTEVLSKTKGKVLEIGCGKGELLSEIVQKGCDGYGLEPNKYAIEICKKKGLNVKQGIFDSMVYPDEFFDTVIMMHVLEHLPSPKKVFNKVYNCLKKNGKVFIYIPNADSYMANFFGENWGGWSLPFHFYHFTPKTFGELLKNEKFKVKSIRAVTPDFILPVSIVNRINSGNRLLNEINSSGFFRSFPFRAILGFLFRFLDNIFVMKGECLQIEIKKK